jgi:hypothetical protein
MSVPVSTHPRIVLRREEPDVLPDGPGTGLLQLSLVATNPLEGRISKEQILHGFRGIAPSRTAFKISK